MIQFKVQMNIQAVAISLAKSDPTEIQLILTKSAQLIQKQESKNGILTLFATPDDFPTLIGTIGKINRPSAFQ